MSPLQLNEPGKGKVHAESLETNVLLAIKLTLLENLYPALKAWKNCCIERGDSYAKMSACPPDFERTVYFSLPIQLIF